MTTHSSWTSTTGVNKWYQNELESTQRQYKKRKKAKGKHQANKNLQKNNGLIIWHKLRDQKVRRQKLFPMKGNDEACTLIIRCQIEAIRHNKKPLAMIVEEWRLFIEIARSTIQMHLAENVYFSMAKESSAFDLCAKLQSIYENKSRSSNSSWFYNCSTWRWGRQGWLPPMSTPLLEWW